ncbi:phosphodiesterase, partial [bacterium]|nr:phosphodiesterase [bacterium]
VFVGPPFRRGAQLTDASVLDITPTVLAALGLPVADDMDGKALTGAFTDEFLSRAELATTETYETEVRVPRRSTAMDDMPEEAKERLRSLGYMQ